MPEAKHDPINPAHYKAGRIEVIDFIRDQKLDFCLGNVVKYVSRSAHSGNQLTDLKKAQEYLRREVEALELQASESAALASCREPKWNVIFDGFRLRGVNFIDKWGNPYRYISTEQDHWACGFVAAQAGDMWLLHHRPTDDDMQRVMRAWIDSGEVR